MAFKIKDFKKTKFDFPTASVDVSGCALQDFFEADEKPVFIVKGISGREKIVIEQETIEWESAAKIARLKNIPEDIAEKIKKMAEAINLDGDMDSWRMFNFVKTLEIGCFVPRIDFDTAKIIAFNFPDQTAALINKINELSGAGAVKKKQ